MLLGGLLTVAVRAAGAADPAFYLLGLSPDAGLQSSCSVSGLSYDGRFAVGHTQAVNPTVRQGFTWTAAEGRVDLRGPEFPPLTTLYKTSADGSMVIGSSAVVEGGFGTAFRRAGTGPLEPIVTIPNSMGGLASGISADGRAIAGYTNVMDATTPTRAYRWTPETGSVLLPHPTLPSVRRSYAHDISADGRTLVGAITTFEEFGAGVAVRWRNGGTTVEILPGLAPDEMDSTTSAKAVSADGRFVVGESSVPGLGSAGVRWNDLGVLEIMRTVPGHGSFEPNAISGDGTIVVGQAGIGLNGYDAIIWREEAGSVPLAEYLAGRGLQVPAEWKLERCSAMTPDGLSFGGTALNLATNRREAFVASIPAAPALLVFALFAPHRPSRSRRAI